MVLNKKIKDEKNGLFFVLEGSDGSGKTEQSRKLVNALKKKGFKVSFFDFPQYKKDSSFFVKKYLNGGYGKLDEVGPYKASLFYALDRFEASAEIKNKINQGFIVISNRYVGSNLIHQGAKILRFKERKKFYKWVLNLEFNILQIPKPDLNILLYMPAEISQKLANYSKNRKKYIKKGKKDIHENNFSYLKKVESIVLEISKLFNDDFYLVEAFRNNKIISKNKIGQKILDIIGRKIKKNGKKT